MYNGTGGGSLTSQDRVTKESLLMMAALRMRSEGQETEDLQRAAGRE